MFKVIAHDNLADAVTGERIFPGDVVWDTTYPNGTDPFMLNGRSRFIKEDTIVWLAEQAGLITGSDARDSGNSTVVDGADAGVGNGEAEVGESEVGGGKTPKRRAARKTSDK